MVPSVRSKMAVSHKHPAAALTADLHQYCRLRLLLAARGDNSVQDDSRLLGWLSFKVGHPPIMGARIFLLLLLALFAAPALAAETSLDAPAAGDRPTIRSEIQRAHVASNACISTMDQHLPAEALDDVIAYHHCMDKIISEVAKNGTYSVAFELGVDFDRLNDSSIQLKAAYTGPLNQSTPAKTLRNLGRIYFDRVNELATKLHVTSLDVCEAAGWTDCRETVIPWFNEWTRVPKPK
jgi:hypothetical protein